MWLLFVEIAAMLIAIIPIHKKLGAQIGTMVGIAKSMFQ